MEGIKESIVEALDEMIASEDYPFKFIISHLAIYGTFFCAVLLLTFSRIPLPGSTADETKHRGLPECVTK